MSDKNDSDLDDFTTIFKEYGQNDEDIASDDEIAAKTETTKKISRKRNNSEENEENLNSFLFGDKTNLIKNLEGRKTFFLDVGGASEKSDTESNENKELWHDSDDDQYVQNKGEFVVDKQKRKHERIVGKKPKWAEKAEKNEPEEEDSDDEYAIKQSVGYLKDEKPTKSGLLPRYELAYKRLRNINKSTENEGRIMSVEFHPKSTVGIVSGSKGVVSIFAIDGKENKKIHNLYYEKFFIKSCKLTNDGEQLIIGGILKDFHIYNLMTGYKQRTRLPRSVNNLRYFQLSPCGKYIGVIGEFGEIHILHGVSKELLCTMKQEYQSTSLSFSTDSNELYSHSDDNEITIFDIRTHRIKHRFIDEGCVNGTCLALSPNNKFVATGSRQGFVNIYNREDLFSTKYPKPLKSISNLTTEITDMKFNHTTEILGYCSVDSSNAMKLVHVESGTVFSNFPSNKDKFGMPTVLEFSPESGYLGVGNISSQVPLYRLRHYNNY